MRCFTALFVMVGSLALVSKAAAIEPNNDFFDRTILAPGVTSVFDDFFDFTFVPFPDTIVGARDETGEIFEFNDDGGPFDFELGSALFGLPTNDGDISFAVTGFPNDTFDDFHSEFGAFEAEVTTYGLEGEFLDVDVFPGFLEPDFVEDFFFSIPDAVTYDVVINNTIGGGIGGDVDYFTFTGLPAGAEFTAETFEVSSGGEGGLDTVLGWFDEFGGFVDFNDDFQSGSLLSQLTGTVPANGEVTLAVSAFPDEFFIGNHTDTSSQYELTLFVLTTDFPGDFDGDGDVDDDDFGVFAGAFGGSGPLGDFDGDGDVDDDDFGVFAGNFGSGLPSASIPEPTGAALIVAAMAVFAACRR